MIRASIALNFALLLICLLMCKYIINLSLISLGGISRHAFLRLSAVSMFPQGMIDCSCHLMIDIRCAVLKMAAGWSIFCPSTSFSDPARMDAHPGHHQGDLSFPLCSFCIRFRFGRPSLPWCGHFPQVRRCNTVMGSAQVQHRDGDSSSTPTDASCPATICLPPWFRHRCSLSLSLYSSCSVSAAIELWWPQFCTGHLEFYLPICLCFSNYF